jgi:PhnB protein
MLFGMPDIELTPPPLTPYLTVADAQSAIAFLERAFGAKVLSKNPTPDGTKLIHAALQLENGGLVMLSDDFPERHGGKASDPQGLGGASVTMHLDLPDVDAVFARAVQAGATVAMPLADMFWGDRYGIVVDPSGHRWSLATRKKVATADELRAGSEAHFPAKS